MLSWAVKLLLTYSLNKAVFPTGVCDSSPVSGGREQADVSGAQASQLCHTHQLPGNSPGLQVYHMHPDVTDVMPAQAACPDLTAVQAILFHFGQSGQLSTLPHLFYLGLLGVTYGRQIRASDAAGAC